MTDTASKRARELAASAAEQRAQTNAAPKAAAEDDVKDGVEKEENKKDTLKQKGGGVALRWISVPRRKCASKLKVRWRLPDCAFRKARTQANGMLICLCQMQGGAAVPRR